MSVSDSHLKTRLTTRWKAGEPIAFKRIHPQLAECHEELAQLDFLLLDHTAAAAQFNPAAGLLPLANANEEMLCNAQRYRELLQRYPVIAGVCATDPFRLPRQLLQEVKELGFAGVLNWPSVGMIDGDFRTHLENSRIGYAHEVALLKMAKDFELLTVAAVFSVRDAEAMIEIEPDILLVHPGPKAFAATNAPEADRMFESIRKTARISIPVLLADAWLNGRSGKV